MPSRWGYLLELSLMIVVCSVDSILIQGYLFCVLNRYSSTKRVVLNLSILNEYILCDKLRMLTIAQIGHPLPLGGYGLPMDLAGVIGHGPVAS